MMALAWNLGFGGDEIGDEVVRMTVVKIRDHLPTLGNQTQTDTDKQLHEEQVRIVGRKEPLSCLR